MSMIGHYIAITPAQLDALLQNPESIRGLLDGRDELVERIHLSVEKNWEGLHY